MRQVKGSELRPDVQREALDRFCHRMTIEAQRRWPEFAAYMVSSGWKMPDRTDKEWLANTLFWIRKDGKLANNRHYCKTLWGDHAR